MFEKWQNLGAAIDDSFYFVLEKLIRLEGYFIDVAYDVARVVLLIAVLTAALNQILTGKGLKEGLIQTMKAFIFFAVIAFAYPRVIGWITNYAYDLAYGSVGGSVEKYFTAKIQKMERIVSDIDASGTTYHSLSVSFYRQKDLEIQALFSKMIKTQPVQIPDKGSLTFSFVVPSVAFQVMLVVAYDAFNFADKPAIVIGNIPFPDFGNVLKGLLCGFFIILTGIFALLEYLMCLLEFMLVTSVGIILLPLAIWDGSKFATEGYIKAIIGFFFKLFLCTMAIFLLLYGFISMFHMLEGQGFSGSPDQIAFIAFTCLLFFFICKSAPGIAQSLITGAPSLSASGAISAAGGAVAAAAAVTKIAQKTVVQTTASVTKAVSTGAFVSQNGGGLLGGVAAGLGSLAADAASITANAALGLTRSLGGSSLGSIMSSSWSSGGWGSGTPPSGGGGSPPSGGGGSPPSGGGGGSPPSGGGGSTT